METPNPRKGGVMPAPKKYPDEMRDRAIRLVLDIAGDAGSITAACRRIGEQLGINSDTLRGWVKQAQVDAGLRPGTATARSEEHTSELQSHSDLVCRLLLE